MQSHTLAGKLDLNDVHSARSMSSVLSFTCLQVPFGSLKTRDEAIASVEELLAANNDSGPEDRMLIYRMAYLPQEGMFKLMPPDLELGSYKHEECANDGMIDNSNTSFMWDCQMYSVGDFVYLNPRYGAFVNLNQSRTITLIAN